jgi:hypothetical protein
MRSWPLDRTQVQGLCEQKQKCPSRRLASETRCRANGTRVCLCALHRDLTHVSPTSHSVVPLLYLNVACTAQIRSKLDVRKFRIICPFCASFGFVIILNFQRPFVPVLVLHNSEHPKSILYDLTQHNPVRSEVT